MPCQHQPRKSYPAHPEKMFLIAHLHIFSIHPYSDPTELGMFFPEEIKFMVEEVHKYHKIYKSPNKWASGSPYEKTFQHNNSIIVLYDIKPGILYEEVDGLKSKIANEHGFNKKTDSDFLIDCSYRSYRQSKH